MNSKQTKKAIKCIVSSCSLNVNNPKPKLELDKPKFEEITGDIKIFFNPVLQKQFLNNKDVQLMVCSTHLAFYTLVNDSIKTIKSTQDFRQIAEVLKDLNVSITEKFDLAPTLSALFDSLLEKFEKISKKTISSQTDDENAFAIQFFEIIKLASKPLEQRKYLLEKGFTEILEVFLKKNEIKSTNNSQESLTQIIQALHIVTNMSILDGKNLDRTIDSVYKLVWSYLIIEIPELQHQSLSFLWSLAYRDDFLKTLQAEIVYFIKKFNAYCQKWEYKTIELFLSFLSSLLFNEKCDPFSSLDENTKTEVEKFKKFILDYKAYLPEKAKYFVDKIASVLP